MLIIAVIPGLVIFCAMLFLALSKKSGFRIRVAALAALGLMILAVIVCLALIFFAGAEDTVDQIIIFTEPVDKAPQTAGNPFAVFGFILFLIALFVVVVILSLREHRRQKKS